MKICIVYQFESFVFDCLTYIVNKVLTLVKGNFVF